jgi:hypothetical protein
MKMPTYRYQAHDTDDTELCNQIRELATHYPRYGYRRIIALIRQKQVVNHERIRRVWKQERLQVVRVRRPRRSRLARLEATYPGHIWAYDFVEDALATGMQRELVRANTFFGTRFSDECLSQFGRLALADHVADHLAAEHVQNDIQVVVGPLRRPFELGNVPAPQFSGLCGKQLRLGVDFNAARYSVACRSTIISIHAA